MDTSDPVLRPHGRQDVWCIVVAGGSGARFGRPKQYTDLDGRRVIDRSVAVAAEACGGVVVVVPEADVEQERLNMPGVVVVAGGASRSASVRNGLAAVPVDARIVLVHDAARPLAGTDLYQRVIDAVDGGSVGVVPVLAPVDTLRRIDGGTVDRASLRIVQTPQGFRPDVLRAAHGGLAEGTDDASLVEALGHEIDLVEGERSNLKITEPVDLEIARVLGLPRVNRPVGESMEIRTGNGFDIHTFSDDPDRVLVLGGLVFEGERALYGHSDADVISHAIGEALLGAAGLGDLGSHFPDDDERWSGADSIELLDEIVTMVTTEGWQVTNVDCSVIAERPKLAPVRSAMQDLLAKHVGAPVSIKGRRAEGLGALGRSEGIACMASVLLVRHS